MIEIGDDHKGRAGLKQLADVDQFFGHDSRERRHDRGVGNGLFPRRNLRRRGGDACARRIDVFAPRAGPQPCDRFARGAHTIARRLKPFPRHVASRDRIVALLAGTGARREQRFEAIQVRG